MKWNITKRECIVYYVNILEHEMRISSFNECIALTITLLGTLIAMYGNNLAVLVVPCALHIAVISPMLMDRPDGEPTVSVGGKQFFIRNAHVLEYILTEV